MVQTLLNHSHLLPPPLTLHPVVSLDFEELVEICRPPSQPAHQQGFLILGGEAGVPRGGVGVFTRGFYS
jgi:hypothetical protein